MKNTQQCPKCESISEPFEGNAIFICLLVLY